MSQSRRNKRGKGGLYSRTRTEEKQKRRDKRHEVRKGGIHSTERESGKHRHVSSKGGVKDKNYRRQISLAIFKKDIGLIHSRSIVRQWKAQKKE